MFVKLAAWYLRSKNYKVMINQDYETRIRNRGLIIFRKMIKSRKVDNWLFVSYLILIYLNVILMFQRM